MAVSADQICTIDIAAQFPAGATINLFTFNPNITQIVVNCLSGLITYTGNVGCSNTSPSFNKATSDTETIAVGSSKLIVASENTVLAGTLTIAAGATGYIDLKF